MLHFEVCTYVLLETRMVCKSCFISKGSFIDNEFSNSSMLKACNRSCWSSNFCVLPVNIHMCHSMTMSPSIWIFNILYTYKSCSCYFSTKFMWFLYETIKTKFALNLYEHVKPNKFVMIMKSSKTLFSCSKFMAFDFWFAHA